MFTLLLTQWLVARYRTIKGRSKSHEKVKFDSLKAGVPSKLKFSGCTYFIDCKFVIIHFNFCNDFYNAHFPLDAAGRFNFLVFKVTLIVKFCLSLIYFIHFKLISSFFSEHVFGLFTFSFHWLLIFSVGVVHTNNVLNFIDVEQNFGTITVIPSGCIIRWDYRKKWENTVYIQSNFPRHILLPSCWGMLCPYWPTSPPHRQFSGMVTMDLHGTVPTSVNNGFIAHFYVTLPSVP